MHQRRRHSLTAALALAGALLAGAPQAAAPAPTAKAEHVATHVWQAPRDRNFGGFSGIELSPDGRYFHAVTDRAHLYWGRIERDGAGRIRNLSVDGRAHLRDGRGRRLPPGRLGDSEGIALGAGGRIWISFEGLDRIAGYDDPGAPPAQRIPGPKALADLRLNSGMEALAITSDGALLAIPERSGGAERPFPVLRWKDGEWDVPFTIPRQGRWLPTGADIGPDGRLYLLERDFRGLLGFSSRVRRFEADGTGERVLLETRPLQYDNLEGISVWHDGTSLRMTLISDDNFNLFQRTEVVEYRIPD